MPPPPMPPPAARATAAAAETSVTATRGVNGHSGGRGGGGLAKPPPAKLVAHNVRCGGVTGRQGPRGGRWAGAHAPTASASTNATTTAATPRRVGRIVDAKGLTRTAQADPHEAGGRRQDNTDTEPKCKRNAGSPSTLTLFPPPFLAAMRASRPFSSGTAPPRHSTRAPMHATPVRASPADSPPPDDGWSFATRQLHPAKVVADPYAALSTPLYQVCVLLRGGGERGGLDFGSTFLTFF